MTNVLEVVEGVQFQTVDESLVWAIDTSNRGTPTSPAVAVTNSAGTDVKSTVMPSGSPSVSADVISLPSLTALTKGQRYEVRVTYTISGNVQATLLNVHCPT